jgi:uncharacterized protein (TIGR00369 family)
MLKAIEMNTAHFSKLERMYLSANINQAFFQTTEIKIDEKSCEISLEISEKYHHALGAMHGSIYFKLLDDAAFFSASSIVKDYFMLTSSFNIHFTRPFKNGKIKAIGILRSHSKNLFIAESKLIDERGNELAFGSGNFMKSRMPLSEDLAYK